MDKVVNAGIPEVKEATGLCEPWLKKQLGQKAPKWTCKDRRVQETNTEESRQAGGHRRASGAGLLWSARSAGSQRVGILRLHEHVQYRQILQGRDFWNPGCTTLRAGVQGVGQCESTVLRIKH